MIDETLLDRFLPETEPSPYWIGPQMDRRDLTHALSCYRSKDNPAWVGPCTHLDRAVTTVARLAWALPEGGLRTTLETMRWELEEALERALAARGPRSALWPPRPGDIWADLAGRHRWHARLDHGQLKLFHEPLVGWLVGSGDDPDSVWEDFGPLVLASGPAVAEHPYVLAVRDAMESARRSHQLGGRYEDTLRRLGQASPEGRDAHERLMVVLGHAGADEDVCPGCMTEEEVDDPWSEPTLVGECAELDSR
ncbi:hypothetical protein [Nocardiopsis synnemataformans]|uniref:hypothetical protein n=1 Tax=Nocardiopsis synnemataformans TaxID=61305 RepID=UPI003EBE6E1D